MWLVVVPGPDAFQVDLHAQVEDDPGCRVVRSSWSQIGAEADSSAKPHRPLGVRGVTELPKNVNLYGSLGWQHAYGDKNTSSRMAFAGSDAFITQGQAVDEDVMVGDIGVSVQLSRAATLDVGYQGQYGADTRVNSVNANLRWSF